MTRPGLTGECMEGKRVGLSGCSRPHLRYTRAAGELSLPCATIRLGIYGCSGTTSVRSCRFLAEHAALSYYWLLIIFYLISPKVAYNFMQRVEHHASDTYGQWSWRQLSMLACAGLPWCSCIGFVCALCACICPLPPHSVTIMLAGLGCCLLPCATQPMNPLHNPAAEEFLETNREVLKTIPPPMVALNYYRNQDLYLFDE